MDIKTAVDVLKGLERSLQQYDSIEHHIYIEALNTVISSIICEKGGEVLYICDRKKCENCTYPICRYTTDIYHASSFALDEAGIFKERTTKQKKKQKFKDIIKEVIQPNEST